MSEYTFFHMWAPFRESLIAGHKFYVEQASKRLLSQFVDINKEADVAADAWLEQRSNYFDPDLHDHGDFYEAANDFGIEFYQLLSDMRDRTSLSVVAGMYHEWDKQLRQWLIGEMRHWHRGEQAVSKIWSADAGKIADLLASFGWDIRSKYYYEKLDACRLVVNVFKHGEGCSLNDLKIRHSEYLVDPLSRVGEYPRDLDFLDHTYLNVNDEQIQEFSEAIIAFWRDVPERIDGSLILSVPDWFEKAITNDRLAAKSTASS